MKLISMSIRGLGGNLKRKYLTELIRKEEVGLMCIEETKYAKLDMEKCFSHLGSNDIEW